MNLLVTGGAGFIGSHLVRKLLQHKHTVTVLDNLSSGSKKNLPENGFTFWQKDIRDTSLKECIKESKFDAIIHLAAQTMVNVSLQKPDFDASENIQGLINILEAAREGNVKRIIFASSAAIYGDVKAEDLPVKETLTALPLSFYGLSKLTAEKYLELYQQTFGLNYVVFRFSNVYGERQGDTGEGGVISIFSKQLAAGVPLTIFGKGEQTRDFIYAGDVANGIYQALFTEKMNTVYNLSTQTETSLIELTALLEEVSGKTIQTICEPPRKGDILHSSLCNEKVMKALEWQPKTTLKEGLLRTYHYFVAQRSPKQ